LLKNETDKSLAQIVSKMKNSNDRLVSCLQYANPLAIPLV